jgi:hypothetical protein
MSLSIESSTLLLDCRLPESGNNTGTSQIRTSNSHLKLAPMDYKYTSIEEERRGRGWTWKRELIAAVLIATLSSALSSMATFGVMTSVKAIQGNAKEEHRSQQFSCGETFDEAHQRGCTWDALTLTWLHPKCSLYGAQEFQQIGNGSWQYWADPSGLHELGGYQALSFLPAGSNYYTTSEAHLYHCEWMLLRVHDAATTGKLLDTKSMSHEHTRHCLDVLVDAARIGFGENLTQVRAEGDIYDIGWNAC